jgi:hypothetical protein
MLWSRGIWICSAARLRRLRGLHMGFDACFAGLHAIPGLRWHYIIWLFFFHELWSESCVKVANRSDLPHRSLLRPS